MVTPVDFGYNPETAKDHYRKVEIPDDALKTNLKARSEFNQFVKTLRGHGINVLVFDKSKKSKLAKDFTPDNIYTKSWISMGPSGNIILYPLANPSRELEKNAFRYILEDLTYNYKVNRVYNLSMGPGKFLEGTGSLVIDRLKRRVFCSRSTRQDKGLFEKWGWKNSYQPIYFDT